MAVSFSNGRWRRGICLLMACKIHLNPQPTACLTPVFINFQLCVQTDVGCTLAAFLLTFHRLSSISYFHSAKKVPRRFKLIRLMLPNLVMQICHTNPWNTVTVLNMFYVLWMVLVSKREKIYTMRSANSNEIPCNSSAIQIVLLWSL